MTIRSLLILVTISCLCTVAPRAQSADAAKFMEMYSQAQAASAAKDWPKAADLWDQVVKANPTNSRYWLVLANVNYQRKEYRKAIPAYQKALELGGGPPATAAYNIACSYALLGEKEDAIKWLSTAFSLGFRDLPRAQKDNDLATLRDDARVQRLMGTVDVSKMSRVEGWRYDLQLFAAEVHRKGFGVNRKTTPAEFEAAVKRLNEAIPDLSDVELSIEFTKLAVKLGDGHSAIGPGPLRMDMLKSIPMLFYWFEEGMFVVTTDPKYKDLLGAQVLRVGDKTVEEVAAALEPLINRDESPIWVKTRVPHMMRYLAMLNGLKLIPRADQVDLTVKDKDGKTHTVTVAADLTQPNIWNTLPNPPSWINIPQTVGGTPPLYVQHEDKPFWFEYLADAKTVYFQYNSVRDDKDEPLDKFASRLWQFVDSHDVEKFVVDMRWNNGGNTYKNKAITALLSQNKKINLKGKLFIIIGRRVYSAAQNAASQFEQNTDAIFVGEPTGSSPNFVGDEIFFTLPYSKLMANVSDVYWQYGDALDHRIWIAPQIYMPPRFEDYSRNRDPVMDAILAYRQGN